MKKPVERAACRVRWAFCSGISHGVEVIGTDYNKELVALEYTVRAEVIDNIWLFIPLGAGLYSFCPKRKVLWLPFALTLFIETAQFATGLGLAQTDDVIGNTLGGIIGFLMAGQFKKRGSRMKVD